MIADQVGPYLTQYILFDQQEKFDQSFQELTTALETDIDWVREHTKLLHQALEWTDNKGNPSYLLRGEGLRKAENWLRVAPEKEPGSSPLQEQFIEASRQNEKRRRTRLIGAVLAALVIIAGISKYAYDRYQDARTERALKLTSQAGLNLYRYPGEAFATASRAKTIKPELSEAEQVRQAALRIIGQRIELAERDRYNWSSGSTFIPLSGPFFRGDLTARISGDGRYVLLATERGEASNKPPGEGYLFDNESLRVNKLEPVDRKDRIKRRLDYLGFGSSEKLTITFSGTARIWNLETGTAQLASSK